MAGRLGQLYDAVFVRNRVKSGADLAHAVAPVVSLTVLSAVIGVNASKLSDEPRTTALVATAIAGLCVFYMVMEVLWESIRGRQLARSLVVLLIALTISRFISPLLSPLSGNGSLADGVLYGWIMSFVVVAYMNRRVEQDSDLPIVSTGQGKDD